MKNLLTHSMVAFTVSLSPLLSSCQGGNPPITRQPISFEPPSPVSPSATSLPEPSATPTVQEPAPTPLPTNTPGPEPSVEPTPYPSFVPTPDPTDDPGIINPPEALFCAGGSFSQGVDLQGRDTLLVSLHQPDQRQFLLRQVLNALPGSTILGHHGGSVYQVLLPAGMSSQNAKMQVDSFSLSLNAISSLNMKTMEFQGNTQSLSSQWVNQLATPQSLSFSTGDPFWQNPFQSWAQNYLKLPQAWSLSRLNSAYSVGIVEFDYQDHVDLQRRYLETLSGYQGNPDFQRHGNHTSSLLNATANNGQGLSGVLMGQSNLHAYQVSTRLECIADAVHRSVRNGDKVLSISLGIKRNQYMSDDELASERERIKHVYIPAIRYAQQQGLLIVAAAGNGIQDDNYRFLRNFDAKYELPAGLAYEFDNVLAVGALSENTSPAYFSNTGSDPNAFVYAPGVQIYGALTDQQYGYMDGTSMATPLVAGIAGLLFNQFPGITAQQVRQAITQSAKEHINGMPVVDAEAALYYAQSHFFPDIPLVQISPSPDPIPIETSVPTPTPVPTPTLIPTETPAPTPNPTTTYPLSLKIANFLGEGLKGVSVKILTSPQKTLITDDNGYISIQSNVPLVDLTTERLPEMPSNLAEYRVNTERHSNYTLIPNSIQSHSSPAFPQGVVYFNPGLELKTTFRTLPAIEPGQLIGMVELSLNNQVPFANNGNGEVRLYAGFQGVVTRIPISIQQGLYENRVSRPLNQFLWGPGGQKITHFDVEVQLDNHTMIYGGQIDVF